MRKKYITVTCHFQAWNLYSYLNETACLLKVEEMVQFSKQSTSWNIILQQITDNVVESVVGVFKCVVLSKAENHVPYRELLATTECIAL